MARANSKGEVRKVMGDVHRSIANLRLVAFYGDEKERIKARTAMRSLQKLLVRGNRKIKKLNQEEIMDVREKKAKRAGKERKVRAVKLEIKKMRSARKRVDHNLVREGISDAYWILGIRRDRKDQALDRLCGSLDPYAGQMTDVGAGMGAGGGFTSADVVVSEGVGF